MNDKAWIDDVFASYQEDLARLIAIESVLDESDQQTPFGQGIDQALDEVLNIAKAMGFETHRHPQGYYGYAEVGTGDLFAILGHIDVVPASGKWDSNPFVLTERDGFLYGRGVSDDKGPVLAAMYALKRLIEEGAILNHRVRFIFGTDEENLWRCIDCYHKNEETPVMGFTPDSTFPLIYAEKGLIQFELKHKGKQPYSFNGGTALNAVADQATYQGENMEVVAHVLKENKRHFTVEEGVITVFGKAVHAKEADQGENALVYLAQALRHVDVDNALVQCIVEEFYNPNGEGVFGVVEDDISGKLMLNVGKVETQKSAQSCFVDIRFPVTFPTEIIRECMAAIADVYELELKEISYLKPIHVARDSFLVTELMKAYQAVTNDLEAEPLVSGGATYARAMDNVVAFGAKLPQTISTEHKVNERISIADMKIAMAIYIDALRRLVTEK